MHVAACFWEMVVKFNDVSFRLLWILLYFFKPSSSHLIYTQHAWNRYQVNIPFSSQQNHWQKITSLSKNLEWFQGSCSSNSFLEVLSQDSQKTHPPMCWTHRKKSRVLRKGPHSPSNGVTWTYTKNHHPTSLQLCGSKLLSPRNVPPLFWVEPYNQSLPSVISSTGSITSSLVFVGQNPASVSILRKKNHVSSFTVLLFDLNHPNRRNCWFFFSPVESRSTVTSQVYFNQIGGQSHPGESMLEKSKRIPDFTIFALEFSFWTNVWKITCLDDFTKDPTIRHTLNNKNIKHARAAVPSVEHWILIWWTCHSNSRFSSPDWQNKTVKNNRANGTSASQTCYVLRAMKMA